MGASVAEVAGAFSCVGCGCGCGCAFSFSIGQWERMCPIWWQYLHSVASKDGQITSPAPFLILCDLATASPFPRLKQILQKGRRVAVVVDVIMFLFRFAFVFVLFRLRFIVVVSGSGASESVGWSVNSFGCMPTTPKTKIIFLRPSAHFNQFGLLELATNTFVLRKMKQADDVLFKFTQCPKWQYKFVMNLHYKNGANIGFDPF